MITSDPAENLKPPKVEKKAPEILTVEEVDKIIKIVDKDCNKVYDPIMEKYIDELKKRCDLI